MRPVVPILTVSALALVLVGCAPAAPIESGDCDGLAFGSVPSGIQVSGEFGAEPVVEIAAPVRTDETTRSLLIEGSGDVIEHSALASLDFTMFNGSTGEVVTSTGHGAEESLHLPIDAQTMAGIVKTVECAQIGDRVVSLVAAADAFGDQGYPDFGIAGGDSVVFVIDIVGRIPNRAEGIEQELPEGFPGVSREADGTPVVEGAAGLPTPETSISAVTILGDGAPVAATDVVWIQYQGIDAETGEIFQQTWDSTGPYNGSASGFVTGFTEALIGQTVGSQFVVVIPPAEAYGEAGGENAHDLAGKTLLFVVDVLHAATLG